MTNQLSKTRQAAANALLELARKETTAADVLAAAKQANAEARKAQAKQASKERGINGTD